MRKREKEKGKGGKGRKSENWGLVYIFVEILLSVCQAFLVEVCLLFNSVYELFF